MPLLVTGVLVGGCSAPGGDGGEAGDRTASGSGRPPSAAGAPSPVSTTPSPVFAPDPSLVPATASGGRSLVDAVVFTPADWGRGFTARNPAESTPGTWAVLDGDCRWQRERLPAGVLAGLSRYSVRRDAGGAGSVTVTAVATVHASVTSADGQLVTTLEEVLRCPEQRPRDGELISGLTSTGTPFGAREQNYADDSVLEVGLYAERGGAAQPYRWMLARLGTVVVAVSVTGSKNHPQAELDQLGGNALARMLERVRQRLEAK